MRPAVVRVGRGLAIAVAVVAWAVAAHYTSALVDESSWGALLAIAPFALIAAAFAWQSTRRGLMLALLATATLVLALAWPTLARNVGWLYFVQHVGTNALLGLGFGRTLGAGREPMCTRIARTMHGTVSPALARYTRQVTAAWAVFFAGTVAISCLLFAFGTIEAWSTFANLLTMPLVGLMFLAEYLVRLRLLPEDRSSILDAVRAYRRTSPTASPVNER
ncbi:hypothetical protein AzCIB_1900 [Azoarcus sp. CIB]|uniref:COG4648 family protein n=1 Tax=Aromatoleum sp. (strain CIB) TaxID=198107 RepID=UPI00067BD7E6|nr:hypothetical protein [Azoarcus sp. CIB]AKU11795.1 hypothetical protein AzCIB_1900 [Azoarcus sp. CIB]